MPYAPHLLSRRDFIAASASALAIGLIPGTGFANVPVPYDWNAAPPTDGRTQFIDWMVKNWSASPAV